MTKRIGLTVLAAGLIYLWPPGSSGIAEANSQGRHGKFEQSRRSDFRPGWSYSRPGFRGDLRPNRGRYEPPPRWGARRQDMRENWRDVQRDRAALQRHLNQYYRDREALQRAHRRGASRAEIARLRARLAESARKVRDSRQDLRGNYGELRRDSDRFGYGSWWSPIWDRFALDYGRD
jgi:hypothetical protein